MNKENGTSAAVWQQYSQKPCCRCGKVHCQQFTNVAGAISKIVFEMVPCYPDGPVYRKEFYQIEPGTLTTDANNIEDIKDGNQVNHQKCPKRNGLQSENEEENVVRVQCCKRCGKNLAKFKESGTSPIDCNCCEKAVNTEHKSNRCSISSTTDHPRKSRTSQTSNVCGEVQNTRQSQASEGRRHSEAAESRRHSEAAESRRYSETANSRRLSHDSQSRRLSNASETREKCFGMETKPKSQTEFPRKSLISEASKKSNRSECKRKSILSEGRRKSLGLDTRREDTEESLQTSETRMVTATFLQTVLPNCPGHSTNDDNYDNEDNEETDDFCCEEICCVEPLCPACRFLPCFCEEKDGEIKDKSEEKNSTDSRSTEEEPKKKWCKLFRNKKK